jgi:3-phenylpropionate/trans-cinnamate dioxygenase ferredoxin reductase subunit
MPMLMSELDAGVKNIARCYRRRLYRAGSRRGAAQAGLPGDLARSAAARAGAGGRAEELSAFYEAEHRAHGVDLRTGVAVEAIEGEGRVAGVRWPMAAVIECRLVIVGHRHRARCRPLLIARARRAATGSTSMSSAARRLPDVYAIGDCAAHACEFAGGRSCVWNPCRMPTIRQPASPRRSVGDPQPYRRDAVVLVEPV